MYSREIERRYAMLALMNDPKPQYERSWADWCKACAYVEGQFGRLGFLRPTREGPKRY